MSVIKATYLEKYSVAPPPSRDYYGLRVLDNEVTLFHWRISHGPHKSPLIQIVDFTEWRTDKLLQETIEIIFGQSWLHYINDIVLKHRIEEIGIHKSEENKGMSHDWRQLLKETKDIEMQYGFQKNPRTKGPSTTIKLQQQQKTLSNSKLSPRPQLEIIRTMSAARRLAGDHSTSKINSHDPDKILITNNEDIQGKSSSKHLSAGLNKERKLVNIINLEANDINPQSNAKFKRNIHQSRASKKTTGLEKQIVPKVSSVPKINSEQTKMRSRLNTLPTNPTFSRKMDFSADLKALKSNDIALDDLVRHTLEDFSDPKGILDCKFSWLDGISTPREQGNGDSPKKHDKSFLTNKYKATRASKLLTDRETASSSSLKDQTFGELSPWRAARIKAQKSSEILAIISAERNMKSTKPKTLIGHRKNS